MYCTSCGARLSEGARFCTSCGARVGTASADAGAGTGSAPVGDDSAAGPTGPGPVEFGPAKPGRAAAPGRVTAPGSASGSGRAMASSSSAAQPAQPAQPAPSAQPLEGGAEAPAGEGRPTGLGARMVQFRRTALAAVPTWALVLLALLLAAGTAYAVYKAVTVWALPALVQTQSGEEEEAEEESEEAEEATEEAEEAEEEAAAEEETAQTDEQLMYQLYYEKCQDYIERYGKPGVYDEANLSSAYGLAVAELIDFNNDGVEELLLAWCTESETVASEGFNAGALAASSYVELYRVEVWSYSDGKLVQSYSDFMPTAAEAEGGDYILIYQYEGRLCIYTACTWYEDGDDDFYHSELWLAMGDDGIFETVLAQTGQYRSFSYFLDGAEVTEEEWLEAWASLEDVQLCYLSTWPDGDVSSSDTVLTPKDLVALTNETLAQLEAGM